MSEQVSVITEEGLPEEYPGKVTAFPDNVSHLVYGIFGVQSRSAEEAKRYADEVVSLLSAPGGAGQVERGVHLDQWGFHTEIVMGYWLGKEGYRAFVESPEFSKWWADLPTDASSDLGFFKEVLLTKKDHFHYAAGTNDKVASAALLPLVGSKKFGYWGAYRDRLPASEYDKFLSPFQEMPPERNDETKGKRLSVETPDNICFIREGQGLGACTDEEKDIWDQKMADRVDRWIKILGNDPAKTRCISIRDAREYDIETGDRNMRQSQNGFLLSLADIERAAKTVHEHLQVRQSFIDMYTKPKFEPKMHVWVEVHILKAGDFDAEYVNCHPKTGFLRFFEGRAVN